MAKSQLFGRTRCSTTSTKYGGVFPVRRGHHDEEAFITAHAILDRGGCVLMYAEGGRSRTGELGEAEAGRRAARARVRRAGGSGRDPRLEGRPGVEAAHLPEGHHPVRRADHLRPASPSRPANSSSRRRASLRARQARCTRRSSSRAAAASSKRSLGPRAAPAPRRPRSVGSTTAGSALRTPLISRLNGGRARFVLRTPPH